MLRKSCASPSAAPGKSRLTANDAPRVGFLTTFRHHQAEEGRTTITAAGAGGFEELPG